jgi:hypothetical protein
VQTTAQRMLEAINKIVDKKGSPYPSRLPSELQLGEGQTTFIKYTPQNSTDTRISENDCRVIW